MLLNTYLYNFSLKKKKEKEFSKYISSIIPKRSIHNITSNLFIKTEEEENKTIEIKHKNKDKNKDKILNLFNIDDIEGPINSNEEEEQLEQAGQDEQDEHEEQHKQGEQEEQREQ